jgi:endonuclease/exonuclease/phosphatase family metal-dependent hydrolase
MKTSVCTFLAALFTVACAAGAETITVATYNIEHFEHHFLGFKLGKMKEAKQPGPFQEAVDALKHSNDKENFAVARVITHKAFNPDVLVIEEGCTQANLEYFNKRWLQNAYETVVQFPSNTDQEQHLCMLLKPGFKILQRHDEYRLEKDTVANERGDKLVARGPVFCLVQTPAGYKFWIGVTHQKSKRGNNLEVTQWRNREAVRTHQIMLALQKQGPTDVMLLGDMNDELGEDEEERQPNSGGDSITNLVGPASDQFVLATEQLAKGHQDSFGGYWNPKFRGFIDHAIVTPSMKDQIQKVEVFYGSVAPVASDHFPVFVKLHSDGTPNDGPATAGTAAPAQTESR